MSAKTIKGITVEINGDVTGLGKALKEVESNSKDLQRSLKNVDKALALDPTNTELLAAKQDILSEAVETTKDKLETLKNVQEQITQQYAAGEIDRGAYVDFQRELVYTQNELKKLEQASEDAKRAIDGTGDEAKDAAKKVDDFADAVDEADDESSSLGDTLGDKVKSGFKTVAGVAASAVTALVAASESTMDYRTDMNKLNTAFEQSGFSADAAQGAYKDLVGILGETDQAVEAANHLAKLTDNEEDLAKWTGDILPGVFATFGDSLPLEGLTEAANETAKVGTVTGSLADALNWAGVSEDDFNARLEECTTEQERQALVTETMVGLYGEVSEAYKETSADLIAANEANDAWTSAMAGVGEIMTPVITQVKELGAGLLEDLTPYIGIAMEFVGDLIGKIGELPEVGAKVVGFFSEWGSDIKENWDGLKSGLGDLTGTISTKMDEARQKVSDAIDKIKAKFNFEWDWPKLKLPHFTTTGSFSLNPLSVPKFSVSWYAKGGILDGAQIFGQMGNTFLGGGEAGKEAVLPLTEFYRELESILSRRSEGLSGLIVNVNIDHFENAQDGDIPSLAREVAQELYYEFQKAEAAL